MKRILMVLLVLLLCGCSSKKDAEIEELKDQVEAQAKQIEALSAAVDRMTSDEPEEQEVKLRPEIEEIRTLFVTTCEAYYNADINTETFTDKMDTVSAKASEAVKEIEDASDTERAVLIGISFNRHKLKNAAHDGHQEFIKSYENMKKGK